MACSNVEQNGYMVKKNENNYKYDVIFIGTSIICVLEAIYQSLSGKSVLIIDKQNVMGGAWSSISIFGLHDVENAIHYLMPDLYAFDFMKNYLSWDIIRSEKKYRIFQLPLNRSLKIKYDNRFGRFLSRLTNETAVYSKRKFIIGLFVAVKEALFDIKQPSYYVKGGTNEMLKKINIMLSNTDVTVKYSTIIKSVNFDRVKKIVKVNSDNEEFISKRITFSHGSRLAELTESEISEVVEEKFYLRPSIHILVRDKSPSLIYESIFSRDSLIKYIHDITRFTREANELIGKKKLFVISLQSDVRESDELYQNVLKKLIRTGIVGKSSFLEEKYWQDIYLPHLEDEDLQRIIDKFGKQVKCLKTENLSRGIGLYAKKWATKFTLFKNNYN